MGVPVQALIAVGATLFALLVRAAFAPLLGTDAPMLVFVVAVAVAARYGGVGSAIAATFLSSIVSVYVFMPPIYSLVLSRNVDHVRLGLFWAVAVIIVALTETARRSGARAISSEEAQRESDERFRLLVEGVQDHALLLLDPQGSVVVWNTGAERISGWSTDEIIGQPYATFFTSEDVAAGKPRTSLEAVRREGHHTEQGWRVRKDGSRFAAEVVTTALQGARGELRGFAQVIRDVTERREGEMALLRKEALQRDFFRDVMSSVTEGRLRLCDTRDDLPPALPNCSGVIQLTFDDLASFRRQIRQTAAAMLMPEERWGDLVTAAGEAALNAVVHAGGGVGRVCSAEGTPGGGTVQVWIEDTGSGITVETLPRATLEAGFTTAGTMGHGFTMMLRTADRIWLLTGTGGTIVAIEQDRDARDPDETLNWRYR